MDVFIARRPIFDRLNRVFAYKLVHSTMSQGAADENLLDSALQLIDNSLLVFDLDTLSAGKKLFFTFTDEALEMGCAELLPADRAVIDLHPSVPQTEALAAHCQALRSAGYDVCAPVFGISDLAKPLVQVANLLSVDFAVYSDPGTRRSVTSGFPPGKSLLARSVDSSEDLESAKKTGFTYFEGSFFSQPTIIASSDLPGLKQNYLHLLRALNDPEPDFKAVAKIVGREVSMTYKLLRLVNSAASGVTTRITSIDRALVMVGARALRQWASIIAVAELSANGPVELISCSSIRGRFCQLIGESLGMSQHSQDLFLTGLFSLLDVIAQRPLNLLLDDVELHGPARDALEGQPGAFRSILDLVVAYEQGRWGDVSKYADEVGLPSHRLPTLYVPAVEWANASFESVTAAA